MEKTFRNRELLNHKHVVGCMTATIVELIEKRSGENMSWRFEERDEVMYIRYVMGSSYTIRLAISLSSLLVPES